VYAAVILALHATLRNCTWC